MRITSLRRRCGTLAVAALVGALAAFGATAEASAASGGTFTIDAAVAPSTLDPAEGCGLFDLAAIANLYMRLTQYGTKAGVDGTKQIDPAHIEPWAAKSWKTSNGGKTYTFKLKPGLKFADGTPVTSKDVAYSINRTTTVDGCGLFFVQDGFSDPSLIKSIATPNARTVVFHLTQADNDFPQAMAQPAAGILESSIVQQNGGVKKNGVSTYMASHQAGSGPFVVQSYKPNQSLTLVANPKYKAGPPPASKKIVFNYITSDPTLLLDAKSGSADAVLGLSPQSVASLKSDKSLQIIANTTPTSEQIGLTNNGTPIPQLGREALSYDPLAAG